MFRRRLAVAAKPELFAIESADGRRLDARLEIEAEAVIIHSRGGAFGKPNLRNPDHRLAVARALEQLRKAGWPLGGVWLDSRVARTWPEPERLLVSGDELTLPLPDLVTLIGQRGQAKGRPDGATGHGNSTKQIRIGVPGASKSALVGVLEASPWGATVRLPAQVQRQVTHDMIDRAIDRLRNGATHRFEGSRDYDLLLPSGERLAPKAVFGLALEEVIGRQAVPSDFSAGWGQPCFEIIESAGYPIVAKGDDVSASDPNEDPERVWAEGSPKRISHLRRERARGLAEAKKREFIAKHGHLFCERCGLVPSKDLGPFGDACIEVHHATLAISKMDGSAGTRLSELQCLCANCHRIVHREQL